MQYYKLYYIICLYDCLCTSVPVAQNAYHGGIGCGRVTVSISEFFRETLEKVMSFKASSCLWNTLNLMLVQK